MSMPVDRRPMSPDELEAYKCLCRARFPAASWDKRFFHALQPDRISAKEAPQLWRLFVRYRRQYEHPRKAVLLELAGMLAAPDFRKQRAQSKAVADEWAKYQQAMNV